MTDETTAARLNRLYDQGYIIFYDELFSAWKSGSLIASDDPALAAEFAQREAAAEHRGMMKAAEKADAMLKYAATADEVAAAIRAAAGEP